MAGIDHPLWHAAFRPFFLITALLSILYALLWALVFLTGQTLPGMFAQTGPVLWHAHTMLSGMVMASAAGFLLTALPEFTMTPFPSRQSGLAFCILFAVGQLTLFVPYGLIFSFAAQLALLIWLIGFAFSRLRGPVGSKHRSFAWAMLALLIAVAGFYYDVWAGEPSFRFLRATIGVWMILIILALSRISMRIVNFYLQEMKDSAVYLARPPRRNIAILCVTLYTVAEFLGLNVQLQGFLAVAAAASLFHLQNDWHLGRVLLRRYVWPLYTIYWLMAPGYALMGYSLLFSAPFQSAGRHVLMMGGMGVSIFMVLCIAGRAHSGFPLDRRRYVPLAVILLLIAVGLRLFYAFFPAAWAFFLAILLWTIPFLLYLYYMGPVLSGPRPDDLQDATSAPLSE